MSGDVKIRCLLGRRMVNWIDGMEMELKVERKLYGQIVLILKFLAWDWASGCTAWAREESGPDLPGCTGRPQLWTFWTSRMGRIGTCRSSPDLTARRARDVPFRINKENWERGRSFEDILQLDLT